MAAGDELKPSWTPLKIIQWAVPFLSQKGIKNPRFDAETLIASALKIDRLKVYLQFDRPLDAEEYVPDAGDGYEGRDDEHLSLAFRAVPLEIGDPYSEDHEGEVADVDGEHNFVEPRKVAECPGEFPRGLESEDALVRGHEEIVVREAAQGLGREKYGLGEKGRD